MSLRTRLTLVFGALMGLLVLAEWSLVTALTHDLEQEVAEVAFEAGAEVLGSFFPEVAREPAPSEGFFFEAEEHRPHSKAFVIGGEDGLRELHEVFRPLHERLVKRGGVAVFEQTAVVRRLGTREDVVHTLRLPDTAGVGEGGHVLVLSLDDEGRGIGRRPSTAHGFQIQMQLAQVEGSRLLDHIDRLGGIAIGVDVEQLEDDVDLARWRPPLHGAADPPDAHTPVAAPAAAPMTVEIPISSEGIEQARRTWLQRMLLGSGAILGLGLLVAGWLAHRVTRPLRELSSAAREVGDGALGTQVPEAGDREMGEAIGAFNHMSTRLAALDAEARSLREREHLTEIGEMARGLAHAMRNPLHLLGLSVAELAARGGEESAALAESARGQIQRIDRSLRSFLALSSGSAGALEQVAVDDLARDVVLELVQQGAGGVRVEVESDGPCTLRAVAAELRAVLHVLVVNAVEASPPGAEVGVRVLRGDGRVTMEVLDRGPGLSPRVRERLFTPHLTTKEQGAGMGLFLAQRIATSRYGGHLALEDRPGGGTRAVLEVGDRGEGRG